MRYGIIVLKNGHILGGRDINRNYSIKLIKLPCVLGKNARTNNQKTTK